MFQKGPILLNLLFLFNFLYGDDISIAVFDLTNNGLKDSDVKVLTERLQSEMVKVGGYTLVERKKIDKVFEEQKFQLSGCVEECLIEVGKIAGANQVLLGSVGKIGLIYTVSARLVDANSGELISSSDYDSRNDKEELLTSGMSLIARDLLGVDTPIRVKKNKEESLTFCISTKYGKIKILLMPDIAPKHVESFKMHVDNNYYDGTIFHRVIPGFMIQGGDSNTKGINKSIYGQGGHAAKFYGIGKIDKPSTWNLPAEFSDLSHVRGIVSMARTNDPNSAGSQFFICTSDAFHLDGQYTIFGKVISGNMVLDKIVNSPRDSRDNPIIRIEMEINKCE